jgi:uncharacterized protein
MKRAKLTGDSFYAWDGDVLVVNILGRPSAPSDEMGTPKGNQLRVSVTARPVRGRATDHMLRFLAPQFGVTPDAIEVVFGRMSVNKQLRIRAPIRLPSVFSDAASAGSRQSALFDEAEKTPNS